MTAGPTREVEHLIIGAGVAGLTLHRFLSVEGVSEAVALVDPHPGGYKIGESLIPELFRHPELAKLLPRVQALPSFTPKYGTTFVTLAGRELAYFPIGEAEVGQAMHVARDELETAMAASWGLDTQIDRAAVTAIDWADKVVHTSAGSYRVSGLVFDCSGPAMVVAKSRDDIDQGLPAHATWGYYDVVQERAGALEAAVARGEWSYLEYDVRHRQVIPKDALNTDELARTTHLTLVDEGLWTWQIPVFGGARMSYGVVSRHGPVTPEQYREVAEAHAAPHFELRRRPEDGDSPYDRLHSRSGFARRARTPAGKDFILIADAFGFSDPVYSVGTGLAVSQAIEVARMLAAGPWTQARCEAYTARANRTLDRAQRAFDFWYSGAVAQDDAVAVEIQHDFLLGGLFQSGVSQAYGAAIELAALDSERDPFEIDWEGKDLREPAAALLALEDAAIAGWTLVGARTCAGGVQLRWTGHDLDHDHDELIMLVAHDPSGEQPCFRRGGDLALSYMRGEAGDVVHSAALEALFEAMAERLGASQTRWLELAG